MPAPIRVELVPHSLEWEPKVKAEAARIMSALGDNCLRIHHIGSTAVPTICAKPVLDLLPEVKSLDCLDTDKASLLVLGYEWWGEYGIPSRRYCTLNDETTGRRLVQLHCFQTGAPEIERHLAFRNYLQAHPEKAQEYEAEKKRCQALHPDDSHAYSDAKSNWIETLLPAAVAYCRSCTIVTR